MAEVGKSVGHGRKQRAERRFNRAHGHRTDGYDATDMNANALHGKTSRLIDSQ